MEHVQFLKLPQTDDSVLAAGPSTGGPDGSSKGSDVEALPSTNYQHEFEKVSPPEMEVQRRRFLSPRRPISALRLVFSYILYVFPRSLRPVKGTNTNDLSSTAYLDALRGYAAWIVYNSHVIHENWRPETSYLMSYPCFKILFRGHAQVDIFFVISGYALSYSMLGHMYAKRPQRVLNSLASSTFRRYVRLFVPTAAATFIAMIAISLRLATKGEEPQVLKETFGENLGFWIIDTVQASNPFAHVAGWWYGGCQGTKYLPQMWTIPVEFRGSMILFMFCAATCRMAPRKRLWITWGCIIACFWWQTLYAGLFLAGMWIADIRLWKESQQFSHSVPLSSPEESGPIRTPARPSSPLPFSTDGHVSRMQTPLPTASIPSLIKQIPYIILLMCSLKLLTAPLLINTGHPFPYNLLARTMPPKLDPGAHIHWPLAIGAMLMVFSLDNAPILQKPLRLPVSQFIGELSFGLYAMHNTVRWIVWEKMLVKWQLAYWGPKAIGFWNLLPGYLLMTILVLWAAEWFRMIDEKVVAWGRKLQEWCFES